MVTSFCFRDLRPFSRLLAQAFPYDIREDKNNNINYFTEMARKVQAIRRAGSAALDLAYVAAGDLTASGN